MLLSGSHPLPSKPYLSAPPRPPQSSVLARDISAPHSTAKPAHFKTFFALLHWGGLPLLKQPRTPTLRPALSRTQTSRQAWPIPESHFSPCTRSAPFRIKLGLLNIPSSTASVHSGSNPRPAHSGASPIPGSGPTPLKPSPQVTPLLVLFQILPTFGA